MLKINNHNPRANNNNFILGRGFNHPSSLPNEVKTKKPRNNKGKGLPKGQQEFLRALINKTGKGFKKL